MLLVAVDAMLCFEEKKISEETGSTTSIEDPKGTSTLRRRSSAGLLKSFHVAKWTLAKPYGHAKRFMERNHRGQWSPTMEKLVRACPPTTQPQPQHQPNFCVFSSEALAAVDPYIDTYCTHLMISKG
ncbi:hypothetical protein L484_018761 [Morus notabilis]|uniref:Uncharacterized protein n=1 Tax=Morus notabilis TaxID=981085 RepID=W9QWG8_9ROSA|nr:hypothetical protein L484_018761 [Morus notabilis]